MLVVPNALFVTVPEALIVATDGVPELHEPVPDAPPTDNVVGEAPRQENVAPPIVPGMGSGTTDIEVDAKVVPQLLVTAYEMVALPPLPPNILPLASIDAIVASLDDQVPPDVESLSVVVAPSQNEVAPVIAATTGRGRTVMVCVAIAEPHALEAVKVIVTVPADRPRTVPVLVLTEAIADEPELQVPELVAVVSLSVVVAPAHTEVSPIMVPGLGIATTGIATTLVSTAVV